MYFSEWNGEVAVLHSGGVYKQCPLYVWKGYLFAKYGSGFLRLAADGSTSSPKVRISAISLYTGMGADKLGRLCIQSQVKDARPIREEHPLLIGGPV